MRKSFGLSQTKALRAVVIKNLKIFKLRFCSFLNILRLSKQKPLRNPLEFSGLFYCSVIKEPLSFMLFALLTAHLLYHTHFVLSRTFFHFLWKHFFSISLSRLQVFSNSFSPQRNSYYHLLSGLSRTFFEKF